jgi:translation initiation factor IF-3
MKKKEPENRINNLIKVQSIRLVGENIENGIYDTKFAIKLAQDMGLDLVEISNNDQISVCKIIDYQKFLYEKKRKDREQRKKQKQNQIQIKEIRLTPYTDEHDFNFKLNHAKNFLSNNDKVLASVFFKGREISYKEHGELILLRFAEELKGFGIPEYLPKLEGKRMMMMIKPVKK